MGFADKVHQYWNAGIEPVKDGVNEVLKKAKEYEEKGRDRKIEKENDIVK